MSAELEQIRNFRSISERLATAGQPTEEQIGAIAAAGFDTLINLALPTSDHALPNEARLCARYGLEYLTFPLDFESPELNTALEFFRAMRSRGKQRLFVHCAMNYRVSALIYAYRVAVMREPVSSARQGMLSIWQPSENWRRLMADAARLSLGLVGLQTERLVLREIEHGDGDAMQAYAADPEVVRYMVWGPNTLEQTRAFCSGQLDVQRIRDRRDFELALIDRATGDLIGGVGLRVQNTTQREGDFGYVLRRDYWGKGLVVEAARALLEFGFGVLGLHRIYATADTRNLQSIRVMEKLGLRHEGTLRKNLYLRDAFRDTVLYALLEDDYWAQQP
jgi:[ribosomal protein S5]-alanine N-acetyltransferase